jgi:hypothetical protein
MQTNNMAAQNSCWPTLVTALLRNRGAHGDVHMADTVTTPKQATTSHDISAAQWDPPLDRSVETSQQSLGSRV